MKQLAILGSIVASMCLVLFTIAPNQLMAFMLAGHVPFTDLTVPPVAMLLFWLLTLPTCLLIYRITSDGFWKSIEQIGHISQRQINRTIRWRAESYTIHLLLASVMVHVAINLPHSTVSNPELSFRRRFLPLPA